MTLNETLTAIVLVATLGIIGVFIYVGILLISTLKSIKKILTTIEKTEELLKSLKDIATVGFMKLAQSFGPKNKRLKH